MRILPTLAFLLLGATNAFAAATSIFIGHGGGAAAAAGGGGGSPTIVQSTMTRESGTTPNVAFLAEPTVGNHVVVNTALWSETISSVADNHGNTYTVRVSSSNGSARGAVYTAKVNTTGTPFTITVTKSGSGENIGIVASEWANTHSSAFDSSRGFTATSTIESSTVTAVAANTVLIGGFTDSGSNPGWNDEATEANGNTLIAEEGDRTSGMAIHVHYRTLSSAGAANTRAVAADSSAYVATGLTLKGP